MQRTCYQICRYRDNRGPRGFVGVVPAIGTDRKVIPGAQFLKPGIQRKRVLLNNLLGQKNVRHLLRAPQLVKIGEGIEIGDRYQRQNLPWKSIA